MAAPMALKSRLAPGGFGLSLGSAESFRSGLYLRGILASLGFGRLGSPLAGGDLPRRLTLAYGCGQSVGLRGDGA